MRKWDVGANDSVECSCGARTVVGNLAKPKAEPIFFVGGAYKHGQVKRSTGPINEEKERCLWCGKKWPDNLKEVLKGAIP